MKFRKTMLDLFDVDPFTSATTIASTCMHVFRKCYLKPNTIAIVPHGGYRKKDKHSIMAIKWLKWLAHTEQLDIEHARNGGEAQIIAGGRTFKVDGQLRTDRSILFEFNGCVSLHCFVS